MDNSVAVLEEKKTVLTLEGASAADDPQKLAQEWGAKEGRAIVSVKVIRVLGSKFLVELRHVKATGESVPVAPTNGIDYSRDALLTPFGRATLAERYLLPTEKSPQDALMRAARAFADDEAHAQRLYNYASRLWFMFSTPALSNPPIRNKWGATWQKNFERDLFDVKLRGMPISCFLNYVPDSREGLSGHYSENAWLSSIGGGIGSYWGGVRSNGIKTRHGSASSGIIPFIGVMDRHVLAFAQGVTRRASYAVYLDISHPEILEFLEIRKPTGGDANRKSLNIHNAVVIPDAFMEIIERCMKDPMADDSWPLVDPHSQKVVDTVSAKELWQRLLELRHQTGEPYIMFSDTVNRALPKAQREAGLRVYQSNLCSEITLPTSETRTAVCCLSSVNLEYFDEWSKDENFIPDLIRMLDNILEFFIQNAGRMTDKERNELRARLRELYYEQLVDDAIEAAEEAKEDPAKRVSEIVIDEKAFDTMAKVVEREYHNAMKKAVFSAKQERSVGLGCMGFHSYLQKNNLPFESALATSANRRMFAYIKRMAEKATVKLAQERGSCPDAKGEMRRNMHLMAIAPNASSSIICGGASPGIEPQRANAFTQKTDSGSWLVKNKYLEDLLEQNGQNTEEVWQSIILNKGSVQHLDILTDREKEIFKTAIELDQRWLIEHAAHRQEYICQAQSLNLFFGATERILYLHNVHFMAWKQGVKTLYYLRSEAVKRADSVSAKVSDEALRDTDNTCLSCEG